MMLKDKKVTFLFRQQNKLQLTRRSRYRAPNKVVAFRFDVDIRRQQLVVSVRVPVALAPQHNGPVGGAVVGQRNRVGKLNLDGLPCEDDGVAVPLPVAQAEGVYLDG